MNIRELKDIFHKELGNLYDKEETQTILDYILIDALGIPKLSILSQPQMELDNNQAEKVAFFLENLKKGKPVQYLVGKAHFYGMFLKVTPDVLIPRQETEELVDWIIKDNKNKNAGIKILDVCTGSGCIALALKKHIEKSTVTAIDISEEALNVAAENAKDLNLAITLKKTDALKLEQELKNEVYDIIVSNPPYIPVSDKHNVQYSVMQHEPHLALFVTDENPLVFYKAIAQFAKNSKPIVLYFEIHEDQGEALVALLSGMGFKDIQLKKDLNGKNRMLKCHYFN